MPLAATKIRILENMHARSQEGLLAALMDLYRLTLPPPDDFVDLAMGLRESFTYAHSLLAFSRFAAQASPDGRSYASIIKRTITESENSETFNNLAKDLVHHARTTGRADDALVQKYEDDMRAFNYNPFDLDGFEKTTPDFSARQIAGMKRIQSEQIRRDFRSATWLQNLILAAIFLVSGKFIGSLINLVSHPLIAFVLWVLFLAIFGVGGVSLVQISLFPQE